MERTKKDGATHNHLTDQVTSVDALVNPQSELNNMSTNTIADNNVGIHAETSSSEKLTSKSKYAPPRSK